MSSQSARVFPLEQLDKGPGLYWYTIMLDLIDTTDTGEVREVVTQRCLIDTGSYCLAIEGGFQRRGKDRVFLNYHDASSKLDLLRDIHLAEGTTGKYLFTTVVAQHSGPGGLNFQKECDGVLGLLPSADPSRHSALTNSHGSRFNNGVRRVTLDFTRNEMVLDGPRPPAYQLAFKCPPGEDKMRIVCDVMVHLEGGSVISYQDMEILLDTGTTYSISWLKRDHSLIKNCRDSRIVVGITLMPAGSGGGSASREIKLFFAPGTKYPPCVPTDLRTFRPAVVLLGIQAIDTLRALSYTLVDEGASIGEIVLV